MKLESFIEDISNLSSEDDSNKPFLESATDICITMESTLINMVKEQTGDMEFLNESVEMEPIEPYPDLDAYTGDILDAEI